MDEKEVEEALKKKAKQKQGLNQMDSGDDDEDDDSASSSTIESSSDAIMQDGEHGVRRSSSERPSNIVPEASQGFTVQSSQQSMQRAATQPAAAATTTKPTAAKLGNTTTTSSRSADSASKNNSSNRPRNGLVFPWRLHQLLSEAEQSNLLSTVSWLASGKSFKVHDKSKFSQHVMPTYFNSTKYKSFQRSLNVWGFECVGSGPEKGAMCHRFFERDNPELCKYMTRQSIKDPTHISNQGRLNKMKMKSPKQPTHIDIDATSFTAPAEPPSPSSTPADEVTTARWLAQAERLEALRNAANMGGHGGLRSLGQLSALTSGGNDLANLASNGLLQQMSPSVLMQLGLLGGTANSIGALGSSSGGGGRMDDSNHESNAAEATPPSQQQKQQQQQQHNSFPDELHVILSSEQYSSILSWRPHGRCFRILNPQELETKVLPIHFGQPLTCFAFIDQLDAYGFIKIPQGKDSECYYHELMVKGLPHLCYHMATPEKSNRFMPSPAMDFDFYKSSNGDDHDDAVKRSQHDKNSADGSARPSPSSMLQSRTMSAPTPTSASTLEFLRAVGTSNAGSRQSRNALQQHLSASAGSSSPMPQNMFLTSSLLGNNRAISQGNPDGASSIASYISGATGSRGNTRGSGGNEAELYGATSSALNDGSTQEDPSMEQLMLAIQRNRGDGVGATGATGSLLGGVGGNSLAMARLLEGGDGGTDFAALQRASMLQQQLALHQQQQTSAHIAAASARGSQTGASNASRSELLSQLIGLEGESGAGFGGFAGNSGLEALLARAGGSGLGSAQIVNGGMAGLSPEMAAAIRLGRGNVDSSMVSSAALASARQQQQQQQQQQNFQQWQRQRQQLEELQVQAASSGHLAAANAAPPGGGANLSAIEAFLSSLHQNPSQK